MFEVFSRSYYLGRLYVTPRVEAGDDPGCARMDSTQHERVNEQLYATGEGVERLDAPLVMKLESSHFPVRGDDAVPANTLAIPESLLEGTRIRNPPSLREVLLARRERAQQLLEYSGWIPGPGDGSGSGADGWDPDGDGDPRGRNAGT